MVKPVDKLTPASPIDEPGQAASPVRKRSETREFFQTIGIAVLLALVFRSFLYEPFHIPSSSMKDGLLIGDYIFVSKFSYGYSRYSFPFGIVPIEGRAFGESPKRGDVLVFRLPRQPSIDYIKRVIGLPGDKIQVVDGVLYINNEPVPKEADGEFKDFENGKEKTIPRFTETLPEGKKYNVLDETRFGAVDNTTVYEVPAGHYFMMGDNRDNSTDSRYQSQVGFVPYENIVGRAEIIVLSFGDDLLDLRWDRFFTLIR